MSEIPAALTRPRTVATAALPRAGVLTDVLLIVIGAALVAAAAQVEILLSFTPVPLTLQTAAVLLVGGALGAWRGTVSMALYVAAGLAGAPVYAGGAHGVAQLTGVTGGYLVGFIVAGAIAGRLAERQHDRQYVSSVGLNLLGTTVILVLGTIWLAIELDLSPGVAMEQGFIPFVAGDVLKVLAASAVLPAAWWVVGRVRDQ
ncbi:MAG: biotin transporter BioY [Acidimicrobiales bacterium]